MEREQNSKPCISTNPRTATSFRIRGRKYPEATARIVRLTYDIGVMKGSLDDTNAGITPGYPQKPFCHPFRPAVNAHTKTEVTFGLVPLGRKESSSHLHLTRKSFIT